MGATRPRDLVLPALLRLLIVAGLALIAWLLAGLLGSASADAHERPDGDDVFPLDLRGGLPDLGKATEGLTEKVTAPVHEHTGNLGAPGGGATLLGTVTGTVSSTVQHTVDRAIGTASGTVGRLSETVHGLTDTISGVAGVKDTLAPVVDLPEVGEALPELLPSDGHSGHSDAPDQPSQPYATSAESRAIPAKRAPVEHSMSTVPTTYAVGPVAAVPAAPASDAVDANTSKAAGGASLSSGEPHAPRTGAPAGVSSATIAASGNPTANRLPQGILSEQTRPAAIGYAGTNDAPGAGIAIRRAALPTTAPD